MRRFVRRIVGFFRRPRVVHNSTKLLAVEAGIGVVTTVATVSVMFHAGYTLIALGCLGFFAISLLIKATVGAQAWVTTA